MSNEHYVKNIYTVKSSARDKIITIDPYFVSRHCDVMELGAPAFHMFKKLMRGRSKGHTEKQVIDELEKCLKRWKELAEFPKCPCDKGDLSCTECVEIDGM